MTLGLFLLVIPLAWGQKDTSRGAKINIRQADKGYYSKNSGKNRLIGDVVFEHEGALLYCDSAWLFSRENRIKSFGNVRINQGDTLELLGDYLEYNGFTRKALVTGEEVILRDTGMTLTTDRLRHNRNTQRSYYTTGGVIINSENRLESREGYYHSAEKMFYFKDSVVLTNPRYVMRSDTLDYSSESRIAYFKGPSTITSDSSFIYCENGRYNTVTDIAQFEENAYLIDGQRRLQGDSLYYEKYREYGEAFGNVSIRDTLEQYQLTGAYGEYKGQQDSAFVTGEPLYSLADEVNDSLHIHGDTIYSTMVADSLAEPYRLVQVYHGVRFYKTSLQGDCDSLTYSTRDSTFRMYRDPILWEDSSQVTGDTIYLKTRNQQPDSLFVFPNAFLISLVDSLRHNQISGRSITGKFRGKSLWKVLVDGNGETIYYPEEENGDLMGMNRSLSSNMLIYLLDNQVSRIIFMREPEGKLYPLDKIPPDQTELEGFQPRFSQRPQSKKDLF